MNRVYKIYSTLLREYGKQGWWPLLARGYSSTYERDLEQNEIYEIALGTILTQNTTFTSVQKALHNLSGFIDPKKIDTMELETLKELIKPAGFYNQKSNYIKNFTTFFLALGGKTPSRDELLALKGIGEESADTIRLYGYKELDFVIDAYTKRFFTHINLIEEKSRYSIIKELVESSLKECIKDKKELLIAYHEFHALIVAHAKKYYSKKPYGCFIA